MSGESLKDPANYHWDVHHMSQGIVQWDPGRAEAIKKHFGKFPKDMSVGDQTKAAIWEMKTKYPQAWSALQGEGSSASKVGALVKHYEYPRDTGGAISQRLRFLGGKFKSGGETASPEHPSGAERYHVSEMQQGASAISAKPYIDDEHIDDFIRKTEIARNKMRQLETQGTGGGSQHHHRIRTSLNNRWGSANEVQGG
jgi:hypothetical protein